MKQDILQRMTLVNLKIIMQAKYNEHSSDNTVCMWCQSNVMNLQYCIVFQSCTGHLNYNQNQHRHELANKEKFIEKTMQATHKTPNLSWFEVLQLRNIIRAILVSNIGQSVLWRWTEIWEIYYQRLREIIDLQNTQGTEKIIYTQLSQLRKQTTAEDK